MANNMNVNDDRICYERKAEPPIRPLPQYLGHFIEVLPQPNIGREHLSTDYRFQRGTVSVLYRNAVQDLGHEIYTRVVPCQQNGGSSTRRRRTRRRGSKGRRATRRRY